MSWIWIKIISGIIFVLVPGFTIKENYRKHPYLTIISISLGLFLLFLSLKPLIVDPELKIELYTDENLKEIKYRLDRLDILEEERRESLDKNTTKLTTNEGSKIKSELEEEGNFTKTSILFVFDATSSMSKFAVEIADSIIAAINSQPRILLKHTKMGFIFYRDEYDNDKLVPTNLMPLSMAAQVLKDASSSMVGGGDKAEPILDAIYYATHFYNWGNSGRRIIIGVLKDDAKATTIGTLDTEGRIPTGLDVNSIMIELEKFSIPVVTVQAGPKYGDNLESVMQTLAEGSGGEFIRWDENSTTKTVTEVLVKIINSSWEL